MVQLQIFFKKCTTFEQCVTFPMLHLVNISAVTLPTPPTPTITTVQSRILQYVNSNLRKIFNTVLQTNLQHLDIKHLVHVVLKAKFVFKPVMATQVGAILMYMYMYVTGQNEIQVKMKSLVSFNPKCNYMYSWIMINLGWKTMEII